MEEEIHMLWGKFPAPEKIKYINTTKKERNAV